MRGAHFVGCECPVGAAISQRVDEGFFVRGPNRGLLPLPLRFGDAHNFILTMFLGKWEHRGSIPLVLGGVGTVRRLDETALAKQNLPALWN